MTLKRSNTAFELSLSLFTVIVMLLVAVVFIVIPEIKSYQAVQERIRKTASETARLQREYDRLYQSKMRLEAQQDADRLEARPHGAELAEWVASRLPGASVKSDAEAGRFDVEAPVKSPMDFYGFLDNLAKAPWVLQAGPKVTMRADNAQVRVAFTLSTLPAQREPQKKQPGL